MSNITTNAFEAVLFLAHQREFEQACPIDPEQIASLHIAAGDDLEYDARSERVFQRIEKQLKEASVQQPAMTIIDRLRVLLSPPEFLTLFRKPQDSQLSAELDREIEDQIKQDLEDDTPGRDE